MPKSNDATPLVLLAKSCDAPNDPPAYATLTGHTAAVVQSAKTLLALRGIDSLRAVGLREEEMPRLKQLVTLAALIHDIGKANEHFQQMVRGETKAQLARHEAVGAWCCWREPLRVWLESALSQPRDLPLVIAAAGGHHRKFTEKAFNTKDGCGDKLRVYLGHQDVASVFKLGEKTLDVGPAPTLTDRLFQLPVLSLNEPEREVFRELYRVVRDRLKQDPKSRKLLAIAKAILINADVAGSALPSVKDRSDWMRDSLATRAPQIELSRLVDARLKGKPSRPFQQAVAESAAPITLVEAGCGNGKTVAAYAWFAQQHAGRQLWVTYPTTGTALEGFRGYLLDVADVASDLESSRRDVDLKLCRTGNEGNAPASSGDTSVREADRVESLRVWNRDAVSCTVDTVLGLLQNQRKGMYAWAGLSKSAVVFDEIHSYDDTLFGLLLTFLRNMPGLPVLLMTASLPNARRKALEALCLETHGISLPIVRGDGGLENLDRYELVDAGQIEPVEQVRECLASGGKVLWVSNTVDRCLSVAENPLLKAFAPQVYHSRYRYMDRVRRHKAVIDGFDPSQNPRACLAVTTQVAEMSLDLSADLLVTDLAPVPALIQRLGRLNRRSTPSEPNGVKTALVLPVTKHLPYDEDDLQTAREWMSRLEGRASSQADLVAAWDSTGDAPKEVSSAWLDGGLDTKPLPVRDGSPGITVLLKGDAEGVRKGKVRAVDVALPMPPPHDRTWLTWDLVAHIPVAPPAAITYDRERGGQWVR